MMVLDCLVRLMQHNSDAAPDRTQLAMSNRIAVQHATVLG
jgi:hypothetical protein